MLCSSGADAKDPVLARLGGPRPRRLKVTACSLIGRDEAASTSLRWQRGPLSRCSVAAI